MKTITMPVLGDAMTEGLLLKWYKAEGEKVEIGDVLFEVETEKSTLDVESEISGFLIKILVEAGNEVPVNTPLCTITESREEEKYFEPPTETPSREASSESQPQKMRPENILPQPDILQSGTKFIRISPLAKKMARESNIDITGIQGSGPEGRIIKQDIEKAISEEAVRTTNDSGISTPSANNDGFGIAYEDIELTKMRKLIATRLHHSKTTAPHFYLDLTVDATTILELKKFLQSKSEALGVTITLNDIIVKLAAHALKEHPAINASFLDDRIRIHKDINIGVAVGTEEGLIVPTIHHANEKSISQISLEVKEKANKAMKKRLPPEDYQGGTFTISNMGMFGIESFHAIINPPESAILAVGAIIPKSFFVDGEMVTRPAVKLSLSVDHRILDGVLAARFMVRIKELMEAPFLMFV